MRRDKKPYVYNLWVANTSVGFPDLFPEVLSYNVYH